MAKDDFLSVEAIKGEHGIEAYQLFDAVRNKGLPAYSQEDLKNPLDSLQIEIDKTKVEENRQERIGAINNPGETRLQRSMNKLVKGLLSHKYHIADCLFKESDINKKKYGLKSNQAPAPKRRLPQPELFKDQRVKDAIETAVYMAIWIERENQARIDGQGKPNWNDDFRPELKRIKKEYGLRGNETDPGQQIWAAIAKYYPEIRTAETNKK